MRHLVTILAATGAFLAFDTSVGAVPSAIQRLAAVKIAYVEDGAADGSVMEAPTEAVREVVNKREAGFSDLVSCLSSMQPTRSTAVTLLNQKKSSTVVPLGYVCLDVLMNIAKSPTIFVEDCGDDGFGACVKEGFYFRPDIYRTEKSKAVAIVRKVQERWSNALTTNQINFEYPAWWLPAIK